MWDHQQQQKVTDGVEQLDEFGKFRAVEVCQDQMPGVQVQLEREREQILRYALILLWLKRINTVI